MSQGVGNGVSGVGARNVGQRRDGEGARGAEVGTAEALTARRRARPRSPLSHPLARPLIFAVCLIPFALLAWNAYHDNLGANPIEALEIHTGVWTLRFLVITLSITPARKLLGWNGLARYRRMLGLFTFFYACVHLSMYIGVDMFFNVHDILHDIVKHPYITVGMASFLMLLPLAVTSTAGWVKRLGGRRWVALHRLIYLIAVGGTLHYMWAVKKDIRDPLIYASIFAALLGYRLWITSGRTVRATIGMFAERASPPRTSHAPPP
ncbi:MAG TPA: protein-methionine-sulfoxide reductase heme-binding subunit MsrQ [Gemmatimonadaceae bacterium]|nr:protein-methionine-sulfoxide reductase heme-binding subunit MsrQ [Gemmatimonadaceae bacterium]